MRRMLVALRAVAMAGMRGEFRIGTVESRVARGRVQYMKRIEQGNKLLQRILTD